MKFAEKKEVEQIEGKTILELVKENKKRAYDRGWISNMDVIARLLDFRYRWEDDWEKFVKLLYAWQKKMYESYDLKNDFFKKEWGVVGDNTITLLNYIYNAMIYKDIEENVKKESIPSGGKVNVAPNVTLVNDESGDLLIRAKQALQRVLPPGSTITSGYRSAGSQKRVIDNYFNMATSHPSFSKFKNRYVELRDKKEIVENYMQNIEGRTGWRIALPGLSNHQAGRALDLAGNNQGIIKALKYLKDHPIDGITIETNMGDREGIFPEGSHIHALFRWA